jgi:hypothetical protein
MRLTCNTIRGEAEFRLQRDVSEGEIYLEDMEEPLEDYEYAELYYDTASNDESDALIGYIAKYLCGEAKDIPLSELVKNTTGEFTKNEVKRAAREKIENNAWNHAVKIYEDGINDALGE